MNLQLENPAQKAQSERIEVPFLGNFRERLERLVPASEHEERIGHLREDFPLAGSRAATARDRECVGEVRQRVVVPVTPEEEIGEVEEGVELRLLEIVLAGDRKTLLEECGAIVPASFRRVARAMELKARASASGEPMDSESSIARSALGSALSSSPMKK